MTNEMTVPEMLSDLDKHYSGKLTEWQEVFVASMLEYLQAGEECGTPHVFTLTQTLKIIEIYEEKDEEL